MPMEITLLDPKNTWDEETESTLIKCPVCGNHWYANEEYHECEHLAFALCTYDFPEFALISDSFKDCDVVEKLKFVIEEYRKDLEDDYYDPEESIEQIIYNLLQSSHSTEVTHSLIDEYVPSPPEMTYFITVFGYKV